MYAFVSNPCDSLQVSGCVMLVKLFVNEAASITIVLFDSVAYLARKVGNLVDCNTLTEPYTVSMPVNTYIVKCWVGDAVEELDGFYTLEYVNNWVASGEYVPCFGFLQ